MPKLTLTVDIVLLAADVLLCRLRASCARRLRALVRATLARPHARRACARGRAVYVWPWSARACCTRGDGARARALYAWRKCLPRESDSCTYQLYGDLSGTAISCVAVIVIFVVVSIASGPLTHGVSFFFGFTGFVRCNLFTQSSSCLTFALIRRRGGQAA